MWVRGRIQNAIMKVIILNDIHANVPSCASQTPETILFSRREDILSLETKMYAMGIDPTTSRMRIQRSAIWATRTNLSYAHEFVLRARICTEKWVSSALSAKSPFLQFSFWELVGK